MQRESGASGRRLPGSEQAEHVARRAFYDDEEFAREMVRVFASSWLLLGFASEIPERGDYVVRRMADRSVIVTRTEQGEVNVLLNSCGHRGTQLCRASFGNAAHYRCSYHGWTYSNNGKLTGVPALRSAYPASFNKADYDLPKPRCRDYRGFIFATWNEDAPELEAYLGDFRWYLDAMLDMAGGEWEVYGAPQRTVAVGNWKVPTDNFAGDGYHMQTTHQAAFEQGVYGDSLAGGTLGRNDLDLLAVNVGTPQGHALRAAYVVTQGEDRLQPSVDTPMYLGYPPEEWETFTSFQTEEQIRFNSHCEVSHGVVFPNAAFLRVSHDKAIGRADDPLTAYTVWRTHTPLDAHRTECIYWTLVPSKLSGEWKRRSYGFQARSQSAGGILFEMDDFENFARIDTTVAPVASGPNHVTLELGHKLSRPAQEFPGPGDAVYMTLSEHNQRAFYRRWAELMDAEGGR